MKQVNIYTQSSIKALKPQNGAIGYRLETETSKGPHTLDEILKIQNATAHQSELRALIEALKRMRQPCQLTIFTESGYVAAGYESGWVEKWTQSGWMTSRKTEVANRKEWEELHSLISRHRFTFKVAQEHKHREWLRSEVEKKAKEN